MDIMGAQKNVSETFSIALCETRKCYYVQYVVGMQLNREIVPQTFANFLSSISKQEHSLKVLQGLKSRLSNFHKIIRGNTRNSTLQFLDSRYVYLKCQSMEGFAKTTVDLQIFLLQHTYSSWELVSSHFKLTSIFCHRFFIRGMPSTRNA